MPIPRRRKISQRTGPPIWLGIWQRIWQRIWLGICLLLALLWSLPSQATSSLATAHPNLWVMGMVVLGLGLISMLVANAFFAWRSQGALADEPSPRRSRTGSYYLSVASLLIAWFAPLAVLWLLYARWSEGPAKGKRETLMARWLMANCLFAFIFAAYGIGSILIPI